MPYVGVMTEVKAGQFDERLLDFSQSSRAQFHVGNGLLDQLTSDQEPLLSRR